MAESVIVKTKLDGTLQIASLGGGAYAAGGALNAGADAYTVSFEEGNFSLTVPTESLTHVLDRGKITSPPSLRLGDDQVMSGSFSAYYRDATAPTVEALMDILNKTGHVGSTWQSVFDSSPGAGDAEVFGVDIKLTITNSGDATDTSFLILPYCVFNYSLAEGDPDVITINFTSHAVRPTVG